FVESFAKEFKRAVPGLAPATERLIQSYGWPGNVRELRNLVERAVLMADDGVLQPSDFETLTGSSSSAPSLSGTAGAFALPAEGVKLEDVERNLVEQALERSGGNQTRAATLLGLHRDQIRYRIEKFGLSTKKN
ncbi:MAG: sigma-54-dependent Fis family transcriptional regulator, partial [Acidobacteria bacterium]|nr:sigma-54-dependent Fis family transcriptional regulator [Acidobacteriota bacterium]